MYIYVALANYVANLLWFLIINFDEVWHKVLIGKNIDKFEQSKLTIVSHEAKLYVTNE